MKTTPSGLSVRLPVRKKLVVYTAVLMLLALSAAVAWFSLRRAPSRFEHYPPITLWAWERPEDLRGFDPKRFGVAYLDKTILISDRIEIIPRRQPLAVDRAAKVIAVVRIEARAGIADLSDPALPEKLSRIILQPANRQVSALQIDFDAGQSQRGFYTKLLHEVRRCLPESMPLSITALASWCAYDDWIRALPVDEAVPMFFRMGPEHPPSSKSGWEYPVREPLCQGVAGVSTDEAWPKLKSGTRLYVFHPRSWNTVVLNNLEGYWP